MLAILKRLSSALRKYPEKDKRLVSAIKTIVGDRPYNLDLYRLAIKHISVAKETARGVKESNERLEYLGDAVLGLVVAEYLFKKFPFKDEGFLTEIRSRIVSRESLNNLAKKIGVNIIVEFNINKKNNLSYKSLYGDTLEALIGAVYLDKGFAYCRRFILRKLIFPHFDLNDIIRNDPNYKSKLIEWAQKETKEVRFEIIEIRSNKHFKEFTAEVFVDNNVVGKGYGFSKKKAEQDAAQKACTSLQIE